MRALRQGGDGDGDGAVDGEREREKLDASLFTHNEFRKKKVVAVESTSSHFATMTEDDYDAAWQTHQMQRPVMATPMHLTTSPGAPTAGVMTPPSAMLAKPSAES